VPFGALRRRQRHPTTLHGEEPWGFHVEVGHEDLETVLNSADAVNSLVALIGGNIPSPAAPWIKLLAPFVASIHQRLRELDRGNGIYISMSWFAPGVFIPTPV
jgi:hypothetical protein